MQGARGITEGGWDTMGSNGIYGNISSIHWSLVSLQEENSIGTWVFEHREMNLQVCSFLWWWGWGAECLARSRHIPLAT